MILGKMALWLLASVWDYGLIDDPLALGASPIYIGG